MVENFDLNLKIKELEDIFRNISGMALFIYYTAVYIYLMEIIPIKFRVVVSTLYMIFWSFGYFLEILVFVLADK